MCILTLKENLATSGLYYKHILTIVNDANTINVIDESSLALASIINVEGVTLVLPSRLFMLNKYWRILALS